ncbi:Carboxypeptidase-like, regulatory domain [Pseudocohnilembus persalinus]|uniref:phosphoglucomutase (alpha-D-glucose-1,6-bisphosphate-dependent) n=1 Tax=Pseudocohnilembus persalinus TaxID=266149 RepID=A0A0V0QSP8_PSEPJ|nr:Carboxypeptidase-like, regulatory domain [Pseudocohnilembus persalinus]|eukprot:KRX05018.1 Carboxypeptidase-like, regulatory domain [Pseudocohnilembus persalinus]
MQQENNNLIKINTIQTKPFEGQKPGTSGLRKKVKVVKQEHYLENFVQAIFSTISKQQLESRNVLVVGGDGRYYNDKAIQIITRMAIANGIDELHIAQNGIQSTPAISGYIRKLNQENYNCIGGFILTASHNPGGPENDFGIKFNTSNGGPALEDFTNKTYQITTEISQYHISDELQLDISKIQTIQFTNTDRPKKNFTVQVFDGIIDYVKMMESIFDFQKLKDLFNRKDFTFCFDGLSGVSGPYAKKIFGEILGQNNNNYKLINCECSEDFDNGHPDPNLTYAKKLVEIMDPFRNQKVTQNIPEFGAACDGDADRNMILGKQFFVTPSDSLAILAANSSSIIKGKLLGVARSMPTSGALDKVAAKLGIQNLFETPTGWKFFGNLMDADKISICGEESFGTGSNHIREKDGIWAILAWLSIIADKNANNQGKLIGIEQIVTEHWKQFGRNYYSRYDYEEVDSEAAKNVMTHLQNQFQHFNSLKEGNKAEVFDYTDPVDNSVSKNQGLIFQFKDGSRIIFRLSGTGSVGATIRVYFEKFEQENIGLQTADALKEIIQLGLELSQIKKLTGREQPTLLKAQKPDNEFYLNSQNDQFSQKENKNSENIFLNSQIQQKIDKKTQNFQHFSKYVTVNLHATFLTQNKYPIRSGKVYLRINNDQIGPVIPNAYGELQLQLSTLQNSVIYGNLTLVFGNDTISSVYSVAFLESRNFTEEKTFVFVPPNSQEILTAGCVVDRKFKPITGANIEIQYFAGGVFLDEQLTKTDQNGCFSETDNITLIENKVHTIIEINKDKYKVNQFNKIDQQDTLQQKMLSPIIMDSYYAWVQIQAKIVDQFGKPVEKAEGQVNCTNPRNKKQYQLPVYYSDSEGILKIYNDNTIINDDHFSCKISVVQNEQYFETTNKFFDLQSYNFFKVDLGVIKLTQRSVVGYIQGQTFDNNKIPLPRSNINFACNVSSITIPEIISDNQGRFNASFEGYYGRDYIFNVSASKKNYNDSSIVSVIENVANNYNYTIPTQELILTYIPQPVGGQVMGRMLYNDKDVAKDFPIGVSLTPSPYSISKNPVNTDKNGAFAFTFIGDDINTYNVHLIVEDEDFALVSPKNAILDQSNQFMVNFGDVYVNIRNLTSEIDGVIVDNLGNKISGADIQVTIVNQQFNRDLDEYQTYYGSAKSDKNGKFTIDTTIPARSIYNVTMVIKAQYLETFTFNSTISKDNHYSLDLGNLKLQREEQEAKIYGTCLDSQNPTTLITTGQLEIGKITPNVTKMPKNTICDTKTGKYEFDFTVYKGITYNGEIDYDDNNEKYVNDWFNFMLSTENNYNLQYDLLINEPIDVLITGQVLSYRQQNIYGAQLSLVIENFDVLPMNTTTDTNGAFTVSQKLFIKDLPSIPAILYVQAKDYLPNQFKVEFLQNNDYTINQYKIQLVHVNIPINVEGQVMDLEGNTIPDAQVELIVKNMNVQQQPVMKYQIGDSLGKFNFTFALNPDYNYQGTVKVQAQYFKTKETVIQLNQGNNFNCGELTIHLEGKPTSLILKGHIINQFYEPLENALISLNFEPSVTKYGAYSINNEKTEKQGYFKIQQEVLEGHIYNATLSIDVPGYLQYEQVLTFTQSNNFELNLQNIFINKKPVNSVVSGIVYDKLTNKTLPNTNIQLLFHQGILMDESFIGNTDKNGKFVLQQQIQSNFTYNLTILARGVNLTDSFTDIQLNQDNNYKVSDIAIYMTHNTAQIIGSISGTVYQYNGRVIPNCQIHLTFQILGMQSYTTTTNQQGNYLIANIKMQDGNIYNPTLTVSPPSQSSVFEQQNVTVIMQKYQYNIVEEDIILKQKTTIYIINGIIKDQKKQPIINANVQIIFPNQLLAQSDFTNSGENGQFQLQNSINMGISQANYPYLYITCDGYQPYFQKAVGLKKTNNTDKVSQKQHPIIYTNQEPLQVILDITDGTAIDINNFQSDQDNSYTITGRIFAPNQCYLVADNDVKIALVQVYFYYENLLDQRYLMAETYTDKNGLFNLNFNVEYSNIQLVISKPGYETKYLFLDNSVLFNNNNQKINLGNIQIITSNGQAKKCTEHQMEQQQYIDNALGSSSQ